MIWQRLFDKTNGINSGVKEKIGSLLTLRFVKTNKQADLARFAWY
jgi:hypothetical protein